jgi:hypothetical protein
MRAQMQDGEGFAVLWRKAQHMRNDVLGLWLAQGFSRIRIRFSGFVRPRLEHNAGQHQQHSIEAEKDLSLPSTAVR